MDSSSKAIERPGHYHVRSYSGKMFEIEIIERAGELGAWFRITGDFVNIKDFVNVEVLKYDSR